MKGLKTVDTSGALAAYESLVKKGLTGEVQQPMAALVAGARQEGVAGRRRLTAMRENGIQ